MTQRHEAQRPGSALGEYCVGRRKSVPFDNANLHLETIMRRAVLVSQPVRTSLGVETL